MRIASRVNWDVTQGSFVFGGFGFGCNAGAGAFRETPMAYRIFGPHGRQMQREFVGNALLALLPLISIILLRMGLLYYRFANPDHKRNLLHLMLMAVFAIGIIGTPKSAYAQLPPIPAETGELIFYHTDHLGSTTIITDAAGNTAQLIEYDPWGPVTKDIGPNYAHYRYTGQEYDHEIGLYNYKAREYAPAMGRFMSADPIVSEPGNPQSLNRYAYVMNNPMKYVDPSGNRLWESFLIGVAGGIAGGLVFAFTGNPILAGMAAGFVVGAIQGAITGGWHGALAGGALGAVMGMLGGAAVGAFGVYGIIALSAASLGIGYATGGWAGVGDVLAMMAGGFIGGMIGYGLGSALSSIGTVPLPEAEFVGYEYEIVDITDATDVYNEPLVNPTGGGIRPEDKWGCGSWGCSRGTRTHWQLDITGQPGQDVAAPFSGIAEPVGVGMESGVRITGVPYGGALQTDLIHVEPSFTGMVYVQSGEKIGTSMNLNLYYPGITNHIHVELFTPGPWNFINPTPYFFLHY